MKKGDKGNLDTSVEGSNVGGGVSRQCDISVIDPSAVEKAFRYSLLDGETIDIAVMVEGIVEKYAFHPQRLEAQRADVTRWLLLLPVEFRMSGGGGWSFLNACYQADGVLWTGFHYLMDQLFCLGIGLGLVQSLMPRDMWESLPGCMPYYAVLVEPPERTDDTASTPASTESPNPTEVPQVKPENLP